MKQAETIPVSTQLTDQPQMSRSFGASVCVPKKLASQVRPSLDVASRPDGYKHLKIYRGPFCHAEI